MKMVSFAPKSPAHVNLFKISINSFLTRRVSNLTVQPAGTQAQEVVARGDGGLFLWRSMTEFLPLQPPGSIHTWSSANLLFTQPMVRYRGLAQKDPHRQTVMVFNPTSHISGQVDWIEADARAGPIDPTHYLLVLAHAHACFQSLRVTAQSPGAYRLYTSSALKYGQQDQVRSNGTVNLKFPQVKFRI
jgi:hypothetical protein